MVTGVVTGVAVSTEVTMTWNKQQHILKIIYIVKKMLKIVMSHICI